MIKHEEYGEMLYHGVIAGEPSSKANSRRVVVHQKTGRHMFIKSKPAMAYVKSFKEQITRKRASAKNYKEVGVLECKLVMVCEVYYKTERKDLDVSLICDCLETNGVIKNDRLIREMHLYHYLDKEFPRSEIWLYERNINGV